MIPYEREQLERAAEEIRKKESEMNSWISAIQSAQNTCAFARQLIYNTLNHDKLKDEQQD